MMTKFSFTHFILILVASLASEQAKAYVELNAFYVSDSFNTGATETSSRMFIEGSLGFSIDKNGRYLVGWNYAMYSVSRTGSTSTAYSSTQMGPRFIWFLTRNKSWSLGLAYNLITTANYTEGSSPAEKWTGTALKADLGYNFALSDAAYLGLRVNYSSATYSSKLIGSTDYSNISNAATYIYPSISLVYYLW